MKKALVFYLYGNRNAGDMAICAGAIELLRSMHYEITMVSRFSEAEEEYEVSREYIGKYFPDVRVCPGPFSFERDFSPAKKIKAYAASFGKLCGILPDRATKALIEEHDVVFFNGGNLLRGDRLKDYLRLAALFYPIELAYRAGKPVFCLPQSTAGISGIGKVLLGRYLRCFQAVCVRESRSFEAMRKAFPGVRFEKSTDLAFFCRDTERAAEEYQERYGVQPESVAIVLRDSGIGDIGRISPEREKWLLDTLLSYVEKHPENYYQVVVQTAKDRAISKRFARMAESIVPVQILEEHDPLVLREIYKRKKFLITMRLHAGILALSAGTPVVGVFCPEWGLKNPGIMEDFGMPYAMAGRDTEVLEALVGRIPEDAASRIAKRTADLKEGLRFPLQNRCRVRKVLVCE